MSSKTYFEMLEYIAANQTLELRRKFLQDPDTGLPSTYEMQDWDAEEVKDYHDFITKEKK